MTKAARASDCEQSQQAVPAGSHAALRWTARLVGVGLLLSAFACTSAPYYTFDRPVNFSELEASPLLRYESGIAAAAGSDDRSAQVLYRVYRAPEERRAELRPPIRTCYLQHGYGVLPFLQSVAREPDRFSDMAESYWSRRLLEALLTQACGEVLVAVQESAVTTVLEMTLRTEAFTRDIACLLKRRGRYRENETGRFSKNCAIIGHSKGGAVVFNLARRCLQKRSTLGAEGCGWIDEYFSAAGVVQGTGMVFIGYGLELMTTGPREDDDSGTQSNPLWLDVGPMAPLEDGVPMAVQNDVALERRGWLRGDFAAFATDFAFPPEGDGELYGCGRSGAETQLYLEGCRAFGEAMGEVLHPRFLEAFQRGLTAARSDARFAGPDGTTNYLASYTWPRTRRSDGLVDFVSGIAACRQGLAIPEARRIVRSCTALENANHWANAGGNPDARLDMIFQLVN